jgi:hypothetical protein
MTPRSAIWPAFRPASLAAALAAACLAPTAAAQLFSPDSATASSQFSGSYDIGNAIDSSGFPAVCSFNTPHATYTTNNHWTTAAFPTNPNATLSFDEPKQLRQFYLWNHRSNGVASDPNYAIKRFNLVFLDASGSEISRIDDLAANQGVSIAQIYTFDAVDNVTSVRVEIVENYGSRYFGFAEVAFSTTVLACNGADLAAPIGQLNFSDLATFLGYFNSQDNLADLAEPVGQFNFADVTAYLNLFNAGCF